MSECMNELQQSYAGERNLLLDRPWRPINNTFPFNHECENAAFLDMNSTVFSKACPNNGSS